MTKPSFVCDYNVGAHPKILENLIKTNFEPLPGYGKDKYCDSAKQKIKEACGRDDIDVYLLTGGTQTNAMIISSMLEQYQGVVAATTGHINVHEAGAIEYTGHKVLTIPGHDGKIDAGELRAFADKFWRDETHEHMVFPGMVYISHPTECGTLYTKKELADIASVCREYSMKLFLDGARLGYGLASYNTDVTMNDIAEYCDVFYIGGTKVGALCGEAVVFRYDATPKYFMTLVKQHGAMLAKGRLLGIQFDTLFTDGLYLEISRHAIDMAEKLKRIFENKGYTFCIDSPTNQQFVLLENSEIKRLREFVDFDFWENKDNEHTVVRFATSWATSEEDLAVLEKVL